MIEIWHRYIDMNLRKFQVIGFIDHKRKISANISYWGRKIKKQEWPGLKDYYKNAPRKNDIILIKYEN